MNYNMIDRPSYIEISTSAYKNNLKFIHSLLPPNCEFSSVVKGNAYGHGLEEFSTMAMKCGVKTFCVFSQDEAQRLFDNAQNKSIRIIIMGYIDAAGIEWAILNNIEFYIFGFDRLKTTLAIAKKLKKKALVHIELETGMNRTGFTASTLTDLYLDISESKNAIQVKGVCTHLAGAESLANDYRVKAQIQLFNRLNKIIVQKTQHTHQLHAACSAAALRYPKTQLDLVRIGILQYGFWPSRELYIEKQIKAKLEQDPLRRLLSWKSHVMEISSIKAGEHIGYGNSFLSQHPMLIAIIPIGYALGYSRSLSNSGRVLIRGKRANVVGIVNMNMIAVDVTNTEGVEIGDEVVLIGKQGDEELSVASFSELSVQVNYELLTRLPMNITRKIIA